MSKEKGMIFYDKVYDIVRLILKGRITIYGAIAKALGMARSSRHVRTAMLHAHDPRLKSTSPQGSKQQWPINRQTPLLHPTQMQDLVESEGILVKAGQVQNFTELFWNPLTEI